MLFKEFDRKNRDYISENDLEAVRAQYTLFRERVLFLV